MKTTLLCTTLAAILLASGCNSADNSGAQTPTHITQHDDSSGSGTGANDTGSGSGAGGAGSGSSTGGTGSGSGTGGTGGDSGAGGAGSGSGAGGTGGGSGDGGAGSGSGDGGTGSGSGAGGTGSGSGDGGTGSGSGTGGTGSGSGAGGAGSGSGTGGTGSGSGAGGTGSGSGTGGTGSGSGTGGTGSGSGTGGTDSGSGTGGTGSGSGTGGANSGSGAGGAGSGSGTGGTGSGSGAGGTGSGSGAGGAGGGSGASADETATDTYCLVTYHLQNQHALSPCSHDGKFGYKAADNTLKITPQFDLAYEFNNNNLARVTEKGKWFYINQNGDKITGAYDWLYEFKDGLARFFKDNKYGYLNQSGQEVIAATYQQAENFNSGLAAVALNNQYGLIDKIGNFVLANTYDELNYLAPKRFRAQKKSANTDEVIDETGAKVRDYVIYKSEGAVQAGDYDMGTQVRWAKKINNGYSHYALINQNREELTPHYFEVQDFQDGVAMVKPINSGGRAGLINDKGKQLTDFKYLHTAKFHNGFAKVQNNGYSFINTTGKEITSKHYHSAGEFNEGFAKVASHNRWGFIDTNGIEITALNYLNVRDFKDGFALVQSANDQKWGAIDRTGKQVSPLKYEIMENLGQGLLAGKENGKWRFLNSTDEITANKFTEITNFGNGFGAGNSSAGWSLIDNNHEIATAIKYRKILKVDDQLFAAVNNSNQYELINNIGTKMGTQTFSYIYEFKDGFAKACKQTGCGLIDKNNNTIVNFNHVYIKSFNDRDFALGQLNQFGSRKGYYHRSGKVIIPLQYGTISDVNYLGVLAVNNQFQQHFKAGYDFLITLSNRKITTPSAIHEVFFNKQTTKPIGNGLVKVATKASKYGFINANGDTVIGIEYEGFDDDAFTDAQPFADAFKNGKKIQINGAGQCIANCL